MRCTTLNIFGFPACHRCPKGDRRRCEYEQGDARDQEAARREWEEACRATVERPNVHAQALKCTYRVKEQ